MVLDFNVQKKLCSKNGHKYVDFDITHSTLNAEMKSYQFSMYSLWETIILFQELVLGNLYFFCCVMLLQGYDNSVDL